MTKQKPFSQRLLEAQQDLAKRWSGPKSFCFCGHHGDGKPSWHAGIIGHGACFHPDCDKVAAKACGKFRWKGFTPEYQKALDRLEASMRKAENKNIPARLMRRFATPARKKRK